MVSTPHSPLPRRTLLALSAAVLLAHMLLLAGQEAVWQVMPTNQPNAPFSTRAVQTPPPATAPAPVTTPAAPTPAKAAVAPKPAKIAPLPVPVPAENTAANMPSTPSNGSTFATENVASTALSPSTTLALSTTATASATMADASPQAGSSTTAASDAIAPATTASPSNVPLVFPASGKFSYIATVVNDGQPKTGAGSLEWTSDGRDYQLRLESSALFITLITQTSVGSIGAGGLQPERYADKRLRRSEKAAHFRRDSGRITFSGNSNSAALQPGAQDRLSVLMQLAATAAGNTAMFMRNSQLSIQVAGTDEADNWVFSVEGEEALELPAGKTAAVRVLRTPRKDFDARLELWLAPTLGYLPVRIKQTEANGNTFDLQLRSPALR